jgi:hypothetical protein
MTTPATPAASAPPVPWEIIRHPATGLALPVPPGWQAVLDAGAPIVLAAPAVPAEDGQIPPFRPNAVATAERPKPDLTTIADYTTASLTNLQLLLTGLQVIAADAVDIAGYDGCRVLCGYRDGIFAIAAEYWWVIANGIATTMTASCQVEQYLNASPVFEDIAAGLVPATRIAAVASR